MWSLLIFTAAALIGSAQPGPIEFDGQYPAVRADSAHVFSCRGFEVDLRYRQLDRAAMPPGDVRSRSVDLLEIRYNRNALSENQSRRGRELLSAFVSIETISATCYGQDISISVRGITRQTWADFLAGRQPLPLPRFLSNMRISRRGVESVDVPR